MSYIIASSEEDRPLRLNDSEFIQALVERWPEACVKHGVDADPIAERHSGRHHPYSGRRRPRTSAAKRQRDSPYLFEWIIPLEAQTTEGHLRQLEGSFFKDGGGLNIVGPWGDCVAFTLWCRALVPEQQPLLFCDDMFNSHIELTATTRAEDIEAAFT